ncbi:putative bifunctional diguanylate cyclase/phosphodiesterase [Quadrisphaera granulorum]|uniref:putative bifunctional diguanylate cyclase/phosphodiesterase n=1 Tax=Quadrisphaera granulorum TaxID=317664 RepID=UPI0014767CF0|nr:bifunctional diguanylate cyclase/phosphodiesterase [Quadrisphaera granulorum]
MPLSRPALPVRRWALTIARAVVEHLVSHPAIVAGRTLGVLLAAWAVILLLCAAAPDVPGQSQVMFAAISVTAVVAAVVAWNLRMSERLLDVALVASTALVFLAVLLAPTSLTAYVLSSGFVMLVVPIGLLVRPAAAAPHLLLVIAARVIGQLLQGMPPVLTVSAVLTILAVALPLFALTWVTRNAIADGLTGLPNRRGIDPAITDAVLLAERTGRPVALAVIDVDGLGAVNTQQGWAAGDRVLRGSVSGLRTHLPETAKLARTGGDSFLVLLPDLEETDAVAVVDAALAALNHPASAGLAVHDVGEGPADLVRRAAAALSHAKLHDRGRCHAAEAGSGPLARDLAVALSDPAAHGLHVELQPVVDVPTGRVAGVEALARWTCPQRGRVSPLDFVGAAEDADLIGALGAFVVRAACREVAPLRARWGSQVFLTVNASGRELVAPGYVEGLLTALDEERFPTTALVLEVTESVLDGGSPAAVEALHALRARGVRVAVDDFGAGYSCLTRLDEVPADFLKLDATLLATAPHSSRRRTLLATAVQLAASLGLTAIAEGAETPEHAALLAELRCPLVQGFGYARPASGATLLEAGPRRSPVAAPA